MVTYFDGQFVEDRDATVNVRARALNYGLGCFGGVRGYLADDGRQVFVFRLDAHIRRLELSAKTLFLRLNVSQTDAMAAVLDTLRANEVHHDVYVRPLVISNSTELSPVLREEDSSFIIYTLPLERYINKPCIDALSCNCSSNNNNIFPSCSFESTFNSFRDIS